MQRKTKINVLLPIRLVGELDSLSRAGKRSIFIENAIRTKLSEDTVIPITEMETRNVMAALLSRKDISEFLMRTLLLELKLE